MTRVAYHLYLRGVRDPLVVLPSGEGGERALLDQLRGDAEEVHFGRGGPGTCGARREDVIGYRAVPLEEGETT